MSTPGPDPKNLEQRVHVLLSGQPLRRAPPDLRGRVLAAIELRNSPWWQRSFPHWPHSMRAVFLAVSTGLIALALAGPRLPGLAGTGLTWLPETVRLVHTVMGTALVVLHGIPDSWLEGAAAFIALLYFITFALGATAYRALYSRS